MNDISLDAVSAAHFAELVRTRFQAGAGDGPATPLELLAVTENSSAAGPGRECFSLLFQGPADCPLAQGTYRFSHEQLGRFDLFIVPVGAERSARQYEAVVNRQQPPGLPGC